MGSQPRGPEDVQGHGSNPRDVKAIPADEPGTQPERASLPRTGEDESDVEGHNFGHNAVLSSQAAQSREREIQRTLRDHDVKTEARRPFFRRGK